MFVFIDSLSENKDKHTCGISGAQEKLLDKENIAPFAIAVKELISCCGYVTLQFPAGGMFVWLMLRGLKLAVC